jgi:hypothetical protein
MSTITNGWNDSDMEEAMKSARAMLAQERNAPEPADLSHLSDEEFSALCPQGYHATGDCVSGPTDDELNVLWNRCGIADEYGHHEGNIFQYARAVLQYWGGFVVRPAPSTENCWINVSKELPDPSKKVLAHYKNDLGNGRTVVACYVPAKTRSGGYDEEFAEYDEDADEFYWPEGWYECIENWEELDCVNIYGGVVTHWRPLPESPVSDAPKQ